MKPSFCDTITSFCLVLFLARHVAAAIHQPQRRQRDGGLGLSQTGPTTLPRAVTSVGNGLVTSMITPTSTVVLTVTESSGDGFGAAQFEADGPIATVIDYVAASDQAASAPATDLTKSKPNLQGFEATSSRSSSLTEFPVTSVPPMSAFLAPPGSVETVSTAFTAGPRPTSSPNSQIGSTPGSITIQSVTPAATSTAAATNKSKASSGAREFTWGAGLFLSFITAILPI